MSRVLSIIAIWVLAMFVLGAIAENWMGLSFVINDEVLNPIAGFLAVGVVAVALVAVGFLVTLSVIGLGIFVVASIVLGVVFAGLSFMWPVLLVIGLVYLITRNRPKHPA
ncbi:hypothetical protein [Alteromonas sp. a30]|uniref:hypothetical protein n=1 Tax=Alteromonas sp. a30 TaxID=2730917 RepID=UPI002280680F|nr:hypothetical protein [Alteromonas sp. a30]MCY7296545.1 hypothetical protein [Alteromonas sp. a30]